MQPGDHLGIPVHPLLQGHGPILGLPPEILLHLQLSQDLDGPLTSRGILLEQLVLLLSDPGSHLLVQLHPRRQVLEHPMDLLRVPTRLDLLLLGSSKLRAHISPQPGLLGKVVPFRLLLVEELGFVPATSNETLKRRPVSKIRKHKNM